MSVKQLFVMLKEIPMTTRVEDSSFFEHFFTIIDQTADQIKVLAVTHLVRRLTASIVKGVDDRLHFNVFVIDFNDDAVSRTGMIFQ